MNEKVQHVPEDLEGKATCTHRALCMPEKALRRASFLTCDYGSVPTGSGRIPSAQQRCWAKDGRLSEVIEGLSVQSLANQGGTSTAA